MNIDWLADGSYGVMGRQGERKNTQGSEVNYSVPRLGADSVALKTTQGLTQDAVRRALFRLRARLDELENQFNQFLTDIDLGDIITNADGLLLLWNTTTDATPTELFLNGVSERITLATDSAIMLIGTVMGRSATEIAGYELRGLVDNDGGTTTLKGTYSKVSQFEDDPGWDVALAGDDSNDAAIIQVTGAAATTINWTARMMFTEVASP